MPRGGNSSFYAPGKSPFHVKGGIYLGTGKYFAAVVPGGMEALYAQIDDPLLLAFIQQKFLPSSWYDVLPVAPLIRAEARAVGIGVADYLKARTVFQAKEDIGGIYRFLLKLVSPESACLRLPGLLSQIFDFGSHQSKRMGPTHLEFTLAGYPRVLWEWYVNAFSVYGETAMKLSGAKTVSLSAHAPKESSLDREVEVVTFVIDCRWE